MTCTPDLGEMMTAPCLNAEVLLNVCFTHPKCPFKALFDADFKCIIHNINMFLWPDPLVFQNQLNC